MKERVSLSGNNATIATVAENADEKMSSVMDRLKKENSSSAVFVLTDEEKASLSGETPTHTLSYAIRDGAKRNEVDGLVLNKTRSELHDAACTITPTRTGTVHLGSYYKSRNR